MLALIPLHEDKIMNTEYTKIDYAQIEQNARRLRAEAIRHFFASLFSKSDKIAVSAELA